MKDLSEPVQTRESRGRQPVGRGPLVGSRVVGPRAMGKVQSSGPGSRALHCTRGPRAL